MARLDRTSGGSNTKKVTLTYLSSDLLFPPHFIYPALSTQNLLTVRFYSFFSDKKKIGLKKQIYFITLGWGQCHNLNELKFTPLF